MLGLPYKLLPSSVNRIPCSELQIKLFDLKLFPKVVAPLELSHSNPLLTKIPFLLFEIIFPLVGLPIMLFLAPLSIKTPSLTWLVIKLLKTLLLEFPNKANQTPAPLPAAFLLFVITFPCKGLSPPIIFPVPTSIEIP